MQKRVFISGERAKSDIWRNNLERCFSNFYN